MKLESQVVGNIGMYYACYQLSRMGWNVMLTSRNAKGIDIIAYDRSGTDQKGDRFVFGCSSCEQAMISGF